MASDIVSRQLFLSRDNFSVSDFVSRQPLLSRDNFFVSNLVSRQRVRPSRDNKKDKLQQKRQPTAVYPAEGKLRQDHNSSHRPPGTAAAPQQILVIMPQAWVILLRIIIKSGPIIVGNKKSCSIRRVWSPCDCSFLGHRIHVLP